MSYVVYENHGFNRKLAEVARFEDQEAATAWVAKHYGADAVKKQKIIIVGKD